MQTFVSQSILWPDDFVTRQIHAERPLGGSPICGAEVSPSGLSKATTTTASQIDTILCSSKYPLDIPYKNLYKVGMANEDSKSRIKWEGDSLEEIRSWPDDVKQNIGGDLRRLEDREQPLDGKPMGKSAPGISELRDEHLGVWYRLMYAMHIGWIYVLHCFTKKTNQTPQRDINLAKERLERVKARKDKPFVKEEEKSA
jgi:phage-related protein